MSNSLAHPSLPSDASFPYEFDPDVSDSPTELDSYYTLFLNELEEQVYDSPLEQSSDAVYHMQEVARKLQSDNETLRQEIEVRDQNMINVEAANQEVYDHVADLASSNIQLSLRLEETNRRSRENERRDEIFLVVLLAIAVCCIAKLC